jgi:hypothetical protein
VAVLEAAHAALGAAPELAVGGRAEARMGELALERLHVAAGVASAQGLIAEAGLGGRDGNGC